MEINKEIGQDKQKRNVTQVRRDLGISLWLSSSGGPMQIALAYPSNCRLHLQSLEGRGAHLSLCNVAIIVILCD